MGVGLVRSLQPPDILLIHWRVYNSIANTSKRVLFLPPSDVYVRSFLYLFYILIKLDHTHTHTQSMIKERKEHYFHSVQLNSVMSKRRERLHVVSEIIKSSLENLPLQVKLWSFLGYLIHGKMLQSFLVFFFFFFGSLVSRLVNNFLAALLPQKKKVAFEMDFEW